MYAAAPLFAARSQARVVVMTFDPHPLEIVAPQRAPGRLMPIEEKVRCLGRAGADAVVILHSDWQLLGMEAEDFVARIIVDKLHPDFLTQLAEHLRGPDSWKYIIQELNRRKPK